METILFIAYAELDGSLNKHSLEVLTAAVKLAKGLSANFIVGLIGSKAVIAASSISTCCATRILVVNDYKFDVPCYAADVVAVEVIAKVIGATYIIAPDNSRFSRALPGVAMRLGGRIDTHCTGLTIEDSIPVISRWLYRQRILVKISRTQRPWLITIIPGQFIPFSVTSGISKVESINVESFAIVTRTNFVALKIPAVDIQTIRPDAKFLFVVGAGWTKKQADGRINIDQAKKLILDFLSMTQASLGSSKSLVNMSSEGNAVLPFLTHMHQVGQTGSTPRHIKGLATCCHGEEPHVVGWRFIDERRAVNIDANCGWAQGKVDVLYVADAFEVMAKVNELLKLI